MSTCGDREEVLGKGAAVGLDRAVEVVRREGVGRVLHRVGGDHQRVVAVGVGGLEVALERDRHGQVADAVAARVAGDADEPDRRLAVAIRPEFDHAGSSARCRGQGRISVAGDVDDGIERAGDLGIAVGLERGGHPGEQLRARPAGDEDAVAEPEAGLVGGVQAVELGGDARSLGLGRRPRPRRRPRRPFRAARGRSPARRTTAPRRRPAAPRAADAHR